jgi:membrane dipeptidase
VDLRTALLFFGTFSLLILPTPLRPASPYFQSAVAGQAMPKSADQLPVLPDMPCAQASDQPQANYQVALSTEQERRAEKLYRNSIIITAHDHCFDPQDFRAQAAAGITIRTIKLTTDGVYWVGGKRYPIPVHLPDWTQRGMIALDFVRKQAADSNGKLVIIRNVADIKRAKREGKIGAVLSFEGARPLDGKLENVHLFYDAGLRDMQLFWAVPSALKTDHGELTPFGLDVIREMDRLGIIIDLSHMSPRAFHQALATTRNPVVISHCGVLALASSTADETRSNGTDQLSDTDIRDLAQNGGVICLHFFEGYIRAHHGPHSTVEDLVDQMDYIRKLVGIDHIALGTDYFAEGHLRWIEGAERMSGMSNVVREMVRQGFSDADIRKVLGLNLMRVYGQVWKKS